VDVNRGTWLEGSETVRSAASRHGVAANAVCPAWFRP
jgi:hypothetical protein